MCKKGPVLNNTGKALPPGRTILGSKSGPVTNPVG